MISKTKSVNNLPSTTTPTNIKITSNTPSAITSSTTTNTNTITTTTTTTKKESLLRKAKSTPKLRSTTATTTINSTTTTTTTTTNKRQKKQSGSGLSSLFKKFSTFLSKIKTISDEVLHQPDDFDLFIDYNMPSSTNITPTEEKFLQDYKKFKSLDLLAAHYNNINQQNGQTNAIISSNDVKSSSTMTSTLQDFIHTQPNSDILPASDEFLLEDIDDENENENESITGEVLFNDIDVIELRKEFENWVNSKNITDTDSKSTLLSQSNIGINLWEYRRNKWLQCNDSNKLKNRLKETSISYIPKDSYVQIYTNLIDKNKTLKDDKHINLLDLLKIINAGWIAEDKWERAARGLP